MDFGSPLKNVTAKIYQKYKNYFSYLYVWAASVTS